MHQNFSLSGPLCSSFFLFPTFSSQALKSVQTLVSQNSESGRGESLLLCTFHPLRPTPHGAAQRPSLSQLAPPHSSLWRLSTVHQPETWAAPVAPSPTPGFPLQQHQAGCHLPQRALMTEPKCLGYPQPSASRSQQIRTILQSHPPASPSPTSALTPLPDTTTLSWSPAMLPPCPQPWDWPCGQS